MTHRRLARAWVVLVSVGWVSGVLSMEFLRQKPLFDSYHAIAASTVAALAITAGSLGLLLDRGRERVRPVHALLGTLAVLLSLGAAVAGFAILP